VRLSLGKFGIVRVYAERVPGQDPFGLFGRQVERFFALHLGTFRFSVYCRRTWMTETMIAAVLGVGIVVTSVVWVALLYWVLAAGRMGE